jgi:hypothetical protein
MDMSGYHIYSLFTDVYGKAAKNPNALSGFYNVSTLPHNENIFSDFLFSPSELTSKPTSSETKQKLFLHIIFKLTVYV